MTVVVERIVANVAQRGGRVVVLSGAGVSAESGIPTFRGSDGFWTRGSKNYRPEELATRRFFLRDPALVWPWYLYRLRRCRESEPNAGHRALVDLEERLGGRFRLITQNVDGLHVRAGSDPNRTFHIHGNLEEVRCSRPCCRATWPMPSSIRAFERGDELEADDAASLRCPACGDWLRPHVLWFDEMYDEEWFRYDSSCRAASECDLLLVIGTSGATNLPMQMGSVAFRSGAIVVDINLAPSPFTKWARASGGTFLEGKSGELLPGFCQMLAEAIDDADQ